jgi:phosphopantothenoylcysteine decarboxylase
MNTKMLNHPATQNNIETLKSYGYQIIPPREALLACGDQGSGALASIETILTTIQESLS